MYLHRLTLSAIGPYADEYTIDFAALSASGLFLLEGPTGSGKSTIIDAIVFALYGSLASDSSSKDRLYSHHAAARAEPFVELVFEVPGGIHRIRRTPQYSRCKRSGSGTTQQNASVTLMKLSNPQATDGEVVSTSTQEAGPEITRILGLSRQQFVQTVVLPQGEFAEFLRSSGEDRRKLLESLFGTEIYERTEAQLVEMRRSAHAGVKHAQDMVHVATERLREAAGNDELDAVSGTEKVEQLASDARAWSVRLESAQDARHLAREQRDAQRRLHDTLKRRSQLLDRHAQLQKAEAEIVEQRNLLDVAVRASSVAQTVRGFRHSEARLRQTAAELSAAELSAAQLGVTSGTLPRAEHVKRRDDLTSELAMANEIAALEAGLARHHDDFDISEQQLAALENSIAEQEEALAGLPDAREPLTEQRRSAQTIAADLGAAEQALKTAEGHLMAFDRLVALRTEMTKAERVRDGAAAVALDAVDVESDLRRRKLRGMSGELARDLVDGQPCSVCGSSVHPSPATSVVDHPTDEAVEQACDERRRLEAFAAAAHADVATATARHDDAASAVNILARDQAVTELDAARARVAKVEAATFTCDRLDAEIAEFDARTQQLRSQLGDDKVSRSGLCERLDAERKQLEADRARVALALTDRAGSVAELVGVLSDDRDALVALIAAIDANDTASADMGARQGELATALHAGGFDDIATAEAAYVSDTDMATLRARVTAHEHEAAVVADGLAHPEIAVLSGTEHVDIEAAEAALARCETELSVVTAEATRASDRAQRSTATLSALNRACAALAAVDEGARPVIAMADVAAASGPANLKGITLGTYVLLRRFEDVVAAANARLSMMSSGRYELQASETKELGSRSRKVGLALAIADHTTDTTRDPKSFSGGETFYASLSLALGLADVVQAEAGGIDLGTLFVDEGFGSLDPETLDAVTNELGKLSSNGRVVGIVSHVEELKQRIADRIEVRALPDGSSSLRTTVGTAA